MPSLLHSLSSLDNVAPVDQEEETYDPRGHYQDVGPSVRRRKANLTEAKGGLASRYEGKTVRLRDMEEEEGSEVESIDGEISEVFSDEGSDDEEVEEKGHSSAASSSSSSSSSSPPPLQPAKKAVRFDEATRGPTENGARPDGTSSALPPARTISSSLSTQAELTKSLREQTREDAKKGEIIEGQLSFWQRTLENRIKVDKVIGARGLGRIDPAAYAELLTATASDVHDSHQALVSSLLDHSASLLHTQTQLIGDSEEHQDLYQAIQSAGSKRKRVADGEKVEQQRSVHTHLLSLSLRFDREVLEPLTSSTLNREFQRSAGQSDKSFAASLKTFDQSLSKQIEIAMAGEGGERLVERTRKYRGEGRRIGATSSDNEEAIVTSSGEGSASSLETFDDSDFYSSLLRSLIESSSSGIGGEQANTPLQFHARTNTKVKGIDTRASKGRKLRYEVIEKIANFMPKITNRERWTEEMRGRLIDVLPGGAAGGRKGEEDEEEGEGEGQETVQQTPLHGLGGLRLFG